MSEDKPYIEIPYALEQTAMEEVKRGTKELMEKVAEGVQQIVWQIANDYIDQHLEVDVLNNYQDAVRNEVVRLSFYWFRRDEIWGKSIRAKILEEHKDELLPLIQNDEIQRLKEELQKKEERHDHLERLYKNVTGWY